ncbi:MAG TPA: SGNH/GDSL hydrolase family protein [Tepidisphaeraceae bacterium]|jgi:lysophospholipase L1-like esterase|nr:SGNH/GDSL hydrolase family protein [Tepidisphaeraceae bacterium]
MTSRAGFVVALLSLWLCSSLVRADDPTPAPFENEIAAFEKADREHSPAKDVNLFVGSSSIRFWKTLTEDFPGVPVLNRGFGGSQIADSTRYAGRIVLPYHAKRIFYYEGDNDLAAGRQPAQLLADFKAFVEKVHGAQPGVPIYFIAVKPSPSRAKLLEKAREANRLIEAYTKEGKNLFYVDVFTPMLDKDGKPRPELFGPDMLHMNRKGYELWTMLIAPLLKG